MNNSKSDIALMTDEILSSRKYRDLHIPSETITSLIEEIANKENNPKTIRKTVREKLHHIVAPYLGDPDYLLAQKQLEDVLRSEDQEMLDQFCLSILAHHASTRERLPIQGEFFKSIFAITDIPHSILDLACGLNPFSFPWMGLPSSTAYFAFDIHQPRIQLINQFFSGIKLAGKAFHQDIITTPPACSADVAFIFKEIHRMEQRQAGCTRLLLKRLDVQWLVITLPAASLTGAHDLRIKHRELISGIISDSFWQMTELQVGGEMVFCIKKDLPSKN